MLKRKRGEEGREERAGERRERKRGERERGERERGERERGEREGERTLNEPPDTSSPGHHYLPLGSVEEHHSKTVVKHNRETMRPY